MYGDKVIVKVIKASRETSQVDFELVKSNSQPVKEKNIKTGKSSQKKSITQKANKKNDKKKKNKH